AGAMNLGDDLIERRALAGDEAGPAARQPLRERVVGVLHVAGRDQRARDRGPPDRLPRLGDRRRQDGPGVEVQTELVEAREHLSNAVDPALTLLGEKAP